MKKKNARSLQAQSLVSRITGITISFEANTHCYTFKCYANFNRFYLSSLIGCNFSLYFLNYVFFSTSAFSACQDEWDACYHNQHYCYLNSIKRLCPKSCRVCKHHLDINPFPSFSSQGNTKNCISNRPFAAVTWPLSCQNYRLLLIKTRRKKRSKMIRVGCHYSRLTMRC